MVYFAAAPLPVQGLAALAFKPGGVQIRWDAVPPTNASGYPVQRYQIYIDRGWDMQEYRTHVPLDLACNVNGKSAGYQERISNNVRHIDGGGCPNHFSACQKPHCHGSASDASTNHNATYRIPAIPTLLPHPIGLLNCTPGPRGVALNGVPIYGPSPDTSSCTGDAVRDNAEMFDVCNGFANEQGLYRYHVPPACLLAQLGASEGAHSPQIGWSLDGFPIYGPRGSLGQEMLPCRYKGFEDPAPCLDSCGGFEGLLPLIDSFTYRYYLPGPLGNLKCSGKVGNTTCGGAAGGAPCCTSSLPDRDLYPYTMNCYR